MTRLASAVAALAAVGSLGLGASSAATTPIGAHAAALRAAAAQVDRSLTEVNALLSRSPRDPAAVLAAGRRLAAAATRARDTLAVYRSGGLRDGTLEEFVLLRTVEQQLLEADAGFGTLAGKPPPKPSAADQQAARRQAHGLDPLVGQLVEAKLDVAGLGEVLTDPSLKTIKGQLVGQLDARLQTQLEEQIRRVTGLGLAIGVPLREQVRGAAEAYVGRLLSKLLVQAGPGGIIIQLLAGDKINPARLVALLGKELREALRNKGSVGPRADRSIASLAKLEQEIVSLSPNAQLSQVRRLMRRAAAAVAATKFLEGDLRRSKDPKAKDRLERLIEARESLAAHVRSYSAVIDSEPFGRDLEQSRQRADRIRADVEGLAGKLGPGAIPTAAVCTPSTFKIEYFLASGLKGGEYDAHLSELIKQDEFNSKCLWVATGPTDEAFVVFIAFAPPTAPGRLAAGDCARTNPSPFYSDKRYLSVGGGHRKTGQQAVGGDVVVLKQVLAAAEAAGVGQACP